MFSSRDGVPVEVAKLAQFYREDSGQCIMDFSKRKAPLRCMWAPRLQNLSVSRELWIYVVLNMHGLRVSHCPPGKPSHPGGRKDIDHLQAVTDLHVFKIVHCVALRLSLKRKAAS